MKYKFFTSGFPTSRFNATSKNTVSGWNIQLIGRGTCVLNLWGVVVSWKHDGSLLFWPDREGHPFVVVPIPQKDQNCQESNDYSHPYKPCSYGNVTFSGLLTSHLRRWSRSPFPCAHLSSLVMPLAATFQPRGARRQVAYHFKGHTVPWGAPEDILRCKLVTKVANMIYIIRSNGWKFPEPKSCWILRAYHWQDLLIFTAWVRSCFIFWKWILQWFSQVFASHFPCLGKIEQHRSMIY